MSDPVTPTTAMTKTGSAANFVWGLPQGVNIATYGRVVSFSSNRTSDKEPLPDENGETDGVVYYNHRNEGTLEAIIKSSSMPTVEIAQSVTIDSVTYIIESFIKNWERGAWAKITLTVVKYQMIATTATTYT